MGNNMFAYCGNNAVIRFDYNGEAFETVFDVISLGASVVDVILNPTDVFAWVGLAGDIVDVAVPFVGGVGELVDVMRGIDVTRGVVAGTDDVVDAAKAVKKYTSNSTGSYEILFKSGKTYDGKGSFQRAITSATQKQNIYNDEVVSLTWKKANSTTDAYIDEYLSMKKHGGPQSRGNRRTYNIIESPGKKLFEKNLRRLN